MQSSLKRLFQKSKETFVWDFLQSLTRTWTFYPHPAPPLRMAGFWKQVFNSLLTDPLDIFPKVPTQPKLLEIHFSKDVNKKLRVWMPAIFGETGWWEGDGQDRIQNGMPYLTTGLYKMQTADWLRTVVFRVRKQWDYCCHVLIRMVKTIVCRLLFTLTVWQFKFRLV